jgi:gliding motility associated protien GldN
MKKLLFLALALAFLAVNKQEAKSQDITRGVYQKENVPYRKPIPMPYLREADVTWSKLIWRNLDLREKANHALYYPTTPMTNRVSLITLLMNNINPEGENPNPIPVYDDDDFKVQLDYKEILTRLGAETTTQQITDIDPITGREFQRTETIAGSPKPEEVLQYLVKEQWYFDKQHSVFRVRVLALCPVRIYYRKDDQGNDTDEMLRRQVFWVPYEDIRPVLVRQEVFNRFNDLNNLSFDDLFLQRLFHGYIFKESNVYDNRAIGEYAIGRNALYEAQRIHEFIFNFEQDLWEY